MNIRRVTLNSLTRPRLIDLVRAADLRLPASAPRGEILDRINRKSSISLRLLLAELSKVQINPKDRNHAISRIVS